MIQRLPLLALLLAFTCTAAAQKPNTKHCYKLKTEQDLFDGTSTTTMSGLKYTMSMVTFTEHVAEGDTTFLVAGTLLANGYDTEPGMIFLFDDGSRVEIPQSTHKTSASSYGWNHVGVGFISREELQEFATKGIRALKIGIYDQEINGNAAKSIFMTGAYCLANR